MGALYDRLVNYSESDCYGFHMPGHKRNRERFPGVLPYGIDITEIDGFDDLHHADGILREAQERAASVYRAGETHFLINGSTAGILSAVLGVTRKGDSVLVARNCHKSVCHAIYMNELKPVYVYPGFDGETGLNTEVSAQEVRDALRRHPEVRAVIIVSPTYDGVVSDVAAIARAAHERGIPLIVDEAHGAHLGFHPYFPENSNVLGADIVIHSLHKTLPSLTQTALLHMNGELADRERVRRYLHMLQSSSPSYVLMASIDECVSMLETRRDELFLPYIQMLTETRERLASMRRLRLAETERYDRSKLVLSAAGTDMNGRELYRTLLDRYYLQPEMMAASYVLAMTSVGDTREGMERLMAAMLEIDGETVRRMESRCRDGQCTNGRCMESRRAGRQCAGVRYKEGWGITDIGRLLVLPAVYTPAEAERMAESMKAECAAEHTEAERAAEPAEPGRKGRDTARLPIGDSAGHISLEYAYLYPPGSPLIVPGERVTEEAVSMLCAYAEMDFRVEGLKKKGYIEVLTDG